MLVQYTMATCGHELCVVVAQGLLEGGGGVVPMLMTRDGWKMTPMLMHWDGAFWGVWSWRPASIARH